MIYKLRSMLSSPTVLSIRSFAAWFSSKILSPGGQSVNDKSERRSTAGNEPLSSKMTNSISHNNSVDIKQKGLASTPLHSPTWNSCSSSSGSGDEEVRELREVFACFDADGDGKISMVELTGVLNALGVDISEREIRATMEAADSDGDGYIDLHDFIRLNIKIVSGTPQAEDELLEAFRLLDTEKGGSITPRGLREMMWRLVGEERTLDDCVHMIKHFDLDGDGVVSFHEFKHMMTATR